MDRIALERIAPFAWRLPKRSGMRVSPIIYADEKLIDGMDANVVEHIGNVACLPGIVVAAYAMPDAQWDYGFRHNRRRGAFLPPWAPVDWGRRRSW
jgi:tRNA-splicing ligase RtcB (3'-phosphate/5'-hydroxy nucleic acid ligase)